MSVATSTPTFAPTETVKPIKATREVKAKIDRLRVIRAEKTALEAESKALSAEILEFAGPVKRAILWGQTTLASIVESHSTVVDTKTLAQAFPEAYAAVVTSKPYSQVR